MPEAEFEQIFTPVHTSTVAETIASQVEDLILAGVLKSGQKLPSERKLSDLTEASRPMVREAIHALEERGLLVSKHGGGTFVTELTGIALSPALVDLFARNQNGFLHYLEFRMEVEGYAAFRAAERGTESDHEIIRRLIAAMDAAHTRDDPEQDALLDVSFHTAIVDAAHNAMLTHMMAAIYDLMRRGVFYNREFLFNMPAGRETLLKHHHAIADAVLARDANSACEAAETHLEYVRRSFTLDSENGERNRIARKRLTMFEQGEIGAPKLRKRSCAL